MQVEKLFTMTHTNARVDLKFVGWCSSVDDDVDNVRKSYTFKVYNVSTQTFSGLNYALKSYFVTSTSAFSSAMRTRSFSTLRAIYILV